MKVFVHIPHEDRPKLRAYVIAEAKMPPDVKHFYLEQQAEDGSWVRSKKIKAAWFERMLKRLGFDVVEAGFLLEEAVEEKLEEEDL